jgi:hypothetical protein
MLQGKTFDVDRPPVFRSKFYDMLDPLVIQVKYLQTSLIDKGHLPAGIICKEQKFLGFERSGGKEACKENDLFLVQRDMPGNIIYDPVEVHGAFITYGRIAKLAIRCET